MTVATAIVTTTKISLARAVTTVRMTDMMADNDISMAVGVTMAVGIETGTNTGTDTGTDMAVCSASLLTIAMRMRIRTISVPLFSYPILY